MEKKAKLTLIESIFVGICLAVLFWIAQVSLCGHWKEAKKAASFSVHAVGAIVGGKKELQMASKSTVLDAVGRLSLLPEAEVMGLPLDMPLKPNQTLVICQKGKLSIFVKGEKGGIIFMPPGSTYKDLYKIFPHKKIKRKRRKLTDGEVVDLS